MTIPLEGQRLGPYLIGARIGAGGMGEVYQARDTRLDRTVAIKLLPSHVADDRASRERFEREARAVGALNHPNICTLHDVGHHENIDFLVMECLEGETLASRLEKGRLPTAQSLQIAAQIASALSRAHRADIVHRDLKPANIFLVRSSGGAAPIAKLLDFGLATTRSAAAGSGATSASIGVTVAPALTTPGMIVGTVQYMAPEQLEGKAVDARTDIFALGAVLYEMLSGRKAFAADSQAGVMAAILNREPPTLKIDPPIQSQAIARIVNACLAKDPDDRWQSTRDLERELAWTLDAKAEPSGPASGQRGVMRPWMWAVAATSFAAAALLLGTQLPRQRAEPTAAFRFEISTPPTSEPMSIAISPDGRQLAFVATSDGMSKLFVRRLDQTTARALVDTDEAIFPFWSPDSRSLGFFSGGKLKTIEVESAAVRTIADAPTGRGGAWSAAGTIVFTPTTASPLMQVPATGGTAIPVTHLLPGQNSQRWPVFLPDGRRFLFGTAQGVRETNGIYVGSLDGAEPKQVLQGDVPFAYVAPDRLLVARDGIEALRFDPAKATVQGDGIRLTESVGWDATMVRGAFGASQTGVLAYRAGLAVPRRLMWFDRKGVAQGAVGELDPDAPSSIEISPDGRRGTVYRTAGTKTNVWIYDLARAVRTRFTLDAPVDLNPIWSSDQHVIRASNKTGTFQIYEKALSGDGDDHLLEVPGLAKLPLSVSPDHRFLLYAVQVAKTGVDILAWPLAGGDAVPVAQTAFDEESGEFSPDGQWVVYQSNESGHMEIYVKPFPGPGTAVQASAAGGTQPRWRRDGKELFYVAPDSRLMAVSIAIASRDGALDPGIPVPLFTTHLATGMNVFPALGTKQQYAVAADGRFLMNVPADGGTIPPITIVTGWDEATRR